MAEELVVDPIVSRQQEIAKYEQNIAVFTSISANTPSEWPEHLLQYKGASNKHDVISKIAELADVELLSDLWTHDDAVAAIRTETLEKRKAEAILAALLA